MFKGANAEKNKHLWSKVLDIEVQLKHLLGAEQAGRVAT